MSDLNGDHLNGDQERPLTRRELREREAAAQAAAGESGIDEPHAEESDAEIAGQPPVAKFDSLIAGSQEAEASALVSEAPSSFDTLFTDDEEPVRKKRGAPKGLIITSVLIVIVLAIGAIGWIGFGDRIMGLLSPTSDDFEGTGNGEEIVFTIIEGDTGTSIAERLEEAGIVKTSGAFYEAVITRTPEPVFIPGAYSMQLEMSASAALDALIDEGNRVSNRFTIPEGSTMADIFEIIESSIGIPVAELEEAAADPQSYGLPEEAFSLEGFLFPATYEFEPGVDARTILETLVERMNEAFALYGVADEDRWFIVRLASIIQREAGLREDYYKVSRVFLNRLDIDMLLESDATVTYGTGNVHRVTTTDAERADASNLYNTYVHPGLTIGPISNPGDIALDAAMNPADGDWLFFVTWNLDTGETIFSNTYEEHLAGVEKWLQWMEENPGYG